MAQHRGRDGEWPRARDDGAGRNDPVGRFQHPDAILRSDRSVAGPLRHGTAPGVGPRGPAVIADYSTSTSYGMDRVAYDRKIERKFPSDLVAREIRGPGPSSRKLIESEGKGKPK